MNSEKEKELNSQILNKYNFISNLYKLTSSTLNLNQLLNIIMDITLRNLHADVGSIILKDAKGTIHSNVVFGLSIEMIHKLEYKKSKLLNYIFKGKKSLLLKDYDKTSTSQKAGIIKSILCAPLKTKETVIGAIFVINKNENDQIINFDKSDLEFFNIIVNNITFSIDNAQLYEEVLTIKNFNSNIINSISNGVITIDFEGKILSINSSAKFIFDLNSNQDYTNKNIKTIISNMSNKGKVLQALETKENLLNLESTFKLKDGSEHILNISTSVLNNPNNEIIGFVLSIDDITEKKSLERQIQRNEQLAALGELSAGLAHEIKNPLTSIKGFSQILPNKLNDKKFLLKFSKIIKTEVDRLNKIIESLLQFAKPKGEKLENALIEKIVEDVFELMNYQIKKAGISVDLELTRVPKVYCNKNQIEQVFINIILNAIQAMEEGGKITAKNELLIKKSPENLFYEYIAYYITDTGPGIPENVRKKLFNPFFTTKTKGTGLGLSITYRIVSEHKGFIEVFSKKKEGTTFVIYLPTVNNWT